MKFSLRDLFWLTLVVGCALAWWMTYRQIGSLRQQVVAARERLKQAADAVNDTEDGREEEIKRTRAVRADLAKYQLLHPDETSTDTVSVDRKTFDGLWAEHQFLYEQFNPQHLRVDFHYIDGKIAGYSMGGILPKRRVVPLDDE